MEWTRTEKDGMEIEYTLISGFTETETPRDRKVYVRENGGDLEYCAGTISFGPEAVSSGPRWESYGYSEPSEDGEDSEIFRSDFGTAPNLSVAIGRILEGFSFPEDRDYLLGEMERMYGVIRSREEKKEGVDDWKEDGEGGARPNLARITTYLRSELRRMKSGR